MVHLYLFLKKNDLDMTLKDSNTQNSFTPSFIVWTPFFLNVFILKPIKPDPIVWVNSLRTSKNAEIYLGVAESDTNLTGKKNLSVFAGGSVSIRSQYFY